MHTHVYEELIVPVLCIAHANWVMDDGLLPGTVFSMGTNHSTSRCGHSR